MQLFIKKCYLINNKYVMHKYNGGSNLHNFILLIHIISMITWHI